MLRHYPLNVRRANEQQGYLKQAVTSDVNSKYRALELHVASVKNEQTGASVAAAGATVQQPFAAFLSEAAGAKGGDTPAHLVVRPGVMVFWADFALTTHLSSKKEEGKAVDLLHAFVRLRTDGSTLLARSVEVVFESADNKQKPASLDSQPNLFAQAQGKFNPAAVKQAPAKKDEDDWED